MSNLRISLVGPLLMSGLVLGACGSDAATVAAEQETTTAPPSTMTVERELELIGCTDDELEAQFRRVGLVWQSTANFLQLGTGLRFVAYNY